VAAELGPSQIVRVRHQGFVKARTSVMIIVTLTYVCW
jgi:hypothetical protein